MPVAIFVLFSTHVSGSVVLLYGFFLFFSELNPYVWLSLFYCLQPWIGKTYYKENTVILLFSRAPCHGRITLDRNFIRIFKSKTLSVTVLGVFSSYNHNFYVYDTQFEHSICFVPLFNRFNIQYLYIFYPKYAYNFLNNITEKI